MQKTAYDRRISDGSSDVCSSDLELVGMQLHRQPQRARGLEHPPRLRQGEADPFAERVYRVDQSLGVQARQPVDHRVDVAIRVAGELRRQRMRAEESGADLDAELVADLPRDAQHLAFVVEVQAVAGLDLQRSDEHTSELQSLMR